MGKYVLPETVAENSKPNLDRATSHQQTIINNMDGGVAAVDSAAVGVEDEQGSPTQERAEWGNKFEFILTMVGYAVGLGNVWRFPYLCYKNGGGAFLIPYFGTLALVGLPLFFLELSFGQFASLGPIAAWSLNPLFKGLGYAMVITNTIIGIYYNVIVSWTIYYFFASMRSTLPWEDCNNEWNTNFCVSPQDMKNITGNFTIVNNETIPRSAIKTPSEEFFYNKVLQLSDGVENSGEIVWELALCLLLAWIIVFAVLIKGISSLGKVVYFSTIFPYVLLTILLIRGVTLEGAGQGILFYLKPDFNRLADARAWSDAATQIFFSLSVCTGGLMVMASYNPFNNNCLRDSIVVPIINCATSFYAGFVIFSVLGFMAQQKGVSVAEVAASGPGLVFVVYPEGLTTMPLPPLWSVLFFLMMMTLGFSSEFSIIECFFSSFIDEFPFIRQSRKNCIIFRALGCTVFYLIGLCMVTKGGFYIFNIFDAFIGGFPLLIVGFFECVAILHVYGYKNFADDIEMMLGKRPNIYFRITWCVLSPLILVVIIIFMAAQYSTPTLFSNKYIYPLWAEGIGWLLVVLAIFLIPVWFTAVYCKNGGWTLLRTLSLPTASWGPTNAKDRTGRYAKPGKTDQRTTISNGKGEMSDGSMPMSAVESHANKLQGEETNNDTKKTNVSATTNQWHNEYNNAAYQQDK